jgi:hypothetical protein
MAWLATLTEMLGVPRVRAARGKAMGRAAKATDACLAEKDLNGALACMQVAEAVYVLLTERPAPACA